MNRYRVIWGYEYNKALHNRENSIMQCFVIIVGTTMITWPANSRFIQKTGISDK